MYSLFFFTIQPFLRQVFDYKPTVEQVNQLGHQFDVVIRETDKPLQSRPHSRSTLTAAGKRTAQPGLLGQRQDADRSLDCKFNS